MLCFVVQCTYIRYTGVRRECIRRYSTSPTALAQRMKWMVRSSVNRPSPQSSAKVHNVQCSS